MIVYQFEHPDYGWISYKTLDDLMKVIRDEIEANEPFDRNGDSIYSHPIDRIEPTPRVTSITVEVHYTFLSQE